MSTVKRPGTVVRERVVPDAVATDATEVAAGVYMPAHQTHVTLAPWFVRGLSAVADDEKEPNMNPTDQGPKPDPWDTADYYECREGVEELTHETLEDALESYLDGCMEPECDAEAVIRAVGMIEVTAYARKTVDPADAKRWAERLADEVNESWRDEEYGNPDDDQGGPGDDEFVREVTAVIQRAFDRTDVWQCERVAKRKFSTEELLAIMRKECPEWFRPAEKP
jgi:hypothetical protein